MVLAPTTFQLNTTESPPYLIEDGSTRNEIMLGRLIGGPAGPSSFLQHCKDNKKEIIVMHTDFFITAPSCHR